MLEPRTIQLLKERNFAHVATLARDGSIQTVVVWVDADAAGRVLLNSAEGRSWPARLRRTGNATVTVMNQSNPYDFVSIVARVVGETHDGAAEHIDALSHKYHGHAYRGWAPGEQRVVFTLEPVQVRHYCS